MRRLLSSFCAVLMISLATAGAARAAVPAASATYSRIDYPGATWTDVYGIARSGPLGRTVEIVGAYGDALGTHGFLLSGGQYTTLDYHDADASAAYDTVAYGINGLHQIVGTFHRHVQGEYKTYSWAYSLGLFRTLYFDGYEHWLHAINNSGMVVGSFWWNTDSEDLSGFAGTDTNVAQVTYAGAGNAAPAAVYGINNHAPHPELVGFAVGRDGVMHGVKFPAPYVLGPEEEFDVPGAVGGTQARGINDTGQIVGSYGSISYYPHYEHVYGRHGFLDDHGQFSRIDFPGAARTVVNGITNPDPLTGDYQVVGSYAVATRPGGPLEEHGFVAELRSGTIRTTASRMR